MLLNLFTIKLNGKILKELYADAALHSCCTRVHVVGRQSLTGVTYISSIETAAHNYLLDLPVINAKFRLANMFNEFYIRV